MTEIAKGNERIRIDKWLWFSRQVKSRTLAQKLIKAGHVRVNSQKIRSPSQSITIGDVLTLSFTRTGHMDVKVLQIEACGIRRGPYAEAQQLYTDLSSKNENPNDQPSPQMKSEPMRIARPDRRQRAIARKLAGKPS